MKNLVEAGDSHETDVMQCGHCDETQNWRVRLLSDPVKRKCDSCGGYNEVWSFPLYVITPLKKKED